MKQVMYNGRSDHYYFSDSAEVLEKGAVYTVTEEKDYGWYTNYKLDELDGEFSAMWFGTVKWLEEFKAILLKEGEVTFSIVDDCVYDETNHLIANFKQFMKFGAKENLTIDFAKCRLSK